MTNLSNVGMGAFHWYHASGSGSGMLVTCPGHRVSRASARAGPRMGRVTGTIFEPNLPVEVVKPAVTGPEQPELLGGNLRSQSRAENPWEPSR